MAFGNNRWENPGWPEEPRFINATTRDRFGSRASGGGWPLLLDQFPLLVGAAISGPLVHLRRVRRAGSGVFEDQAAVPVGGDDFHDSGCLWLL